MYRFMICVAAAQNALYGSTLSPPRLQQVREAAFQYMNSTTLEQDSLFQLLCPEIMAQLKVDAAVPGKVEEVYRGMREHKLLFSKGEKAPLLCHGGPERPPYFCSVLGSSFSLPFGAL